jgi:hypothetical protein
MFSIRKMTCGAMVTMLGLVALSAGCQRAYQPEVAKLNDRPMKVDAAMKLRRWDQTTSNYQNGGVPAWTTTFKREPQEDLNWWKAQIMGPTVFVGNVVFMPVVVVTDKPNRLRTYRGVIVPPSWHAMPPLDPVQ